MSSFIVGGMQHSTENRGRHKINSLNRSPPTNDQKQCKQCAIMYPIGVHQDLADKFVIKTEVKEELFSVTIFIHYDFWRRNHGEKILYYLLTRGKRGRK